MQADCVPFELLRGRSRKTAITGNGLAGDLPHVIVFVGRDLTSRAGAQCVLYAMLDAFGRLGSTSARPEVAYREWLAGRSDFGLRETRAGARDRSKVGPRRISHP